MTLSLHIVYAARHLLALGYSAASPGHPGLSQSDLSILLSVHDEAGLTAKDLVERLGRDKTTVSRSVSRLIEQGLVRTETNILDGRRRDLFLTTEGHAIAQRAANRIREETERLTDRMTPEHVEMINEFLKGLTQTR